MALKTPKVLYIPLCMPQTLKKWGHIGFGLSVCMYVCKYHVCMYVCMGHQDMMLKLHVWIPHGKIAEVYFSFSLNYLPL